MIWSIRPDWATDREAWDRAVREVCELLGETPPPSSLGLKYDHRLHLWRSPEGVSMEGPPPPCKLSGPGTPVSM